MKHYVSNNRLIFESKDLYIVVVDFEIKAFEDYYVKDENGEADLHASIHGIHDTASTGYAPQYYIYQFGEEMDSMSDYIGEPTESFSIEWAEKTIKKYEENRKCGVKKEFYN